MSPVLTQETILIISASSEQAEQVKNSINLRGQEAIETTTFDKAAEVLKQIKPVLAIVDLAILAENQVPFVQHISRHCPVLVMAPEFQEEFFLNVHDAGAKDMLIKPVPEAYLASKILSILEQGRLIARLQDRESILRNYGVISKRCQAFSSSYMLQTLDQVCQATHNKANLSLLIVDVDESMQTFPEQAQEQLYPPIFNILANCARDTDIIGEYMENKFLILMPGTPTNGAESLKNRVFEKLSTLSIQIDENTVKLLPHIGIADYSDCRHYEDFIQKARDTVSSPQKIGIPHPF